MKNSFDLNTHLLDTLGDSDTAIDEPLGALAVSILFFIWPLFVNYKKLIEKI